MSDLKALRHSEHMTEDEMGLHNDLALLQHQQAHAVDPKAVSADWCEDCGIEIPDARRKAVPGVQLCVDCQGEIERHARMYL